MKLCIIESEMKLYFGIEIHLKKIPAFAEMTIIGILFLTQSQGLGSEQVKANSTDIRGYRYFSTH